MGVSWFQFVDRGRNTHEDLNDDLVLPFAFLLAYERVGLLHEIDCCPSPTTDRVGQVGIRETVWDKQTGSSAVPKSSEMHGEHVCISIE